VSTTLAHPQPPLRASGVGVAASGFEKAAKNAGSIDLVAIVYLLKSLITMLVTVQALKLEEDNRQTSLFYQVFKLYDY
jgi:hypothetical protein